MSPLYDLSDDGLPNVYCGVFAIILAILALTSKSIPKKERIAGVVLLVGFHLAFSYSLLDFVWNAFHVPNSIPYRYSFLYSFVILLTAYKGWLIREEIKLWQICISLCATLTLLIARLLICPKGTDQLFILVNVALIVTYAAILTLPKIKEKNIHGVMPKFLKATGYATLFAVVSIELIFNFGNCVLNYNSSRIKKTQTYASEVEAIMEEVGNCNDKSQFYRVETEDPKTLNDGAIFGYNGVSLFSSTANTSVTKFTKALGVRAAADGNIYTYMLGSPISNLFLNIKYVLAETGKIDIQQYFQSVQQSDTLSLKQNQYYLPLGFMVNEALSTLSFDVEANPFDFQNKFISAAVGEEITAFKTIGDEVDNGGKTFAEYTIDQGGLFCLHYDLPAKSKLNITHISGDESNTVSFKDLSFTAIISTHIVQPGDKILVKAICDDNIEDRHKIIGAILNQDQFESAYRVLSQSQMQLTRFENTIVEGEISCHQNGLLYTSIPYNKNWTVYVDGFETEAVLIGDAMIGVNLTQGEHTITIEYSNQALVVGCVVSACSVVAFVGICLIQYRKKRNDKSDSY
jgi:uncharacterized membrane protein YfhO